MERLKRLNPISIFCYFFAVIFLTMFSVNPYYLSASFCFSVLIYSVLSKRFDFKRFAFSLFTILLFIVINAFFSHNGLTVLFYVNSNPITLESVLSGAFGGILIASSIYWFSALNLLLSSDDVIYLFSGISPTFALLISMTLRFFPLMKSRYKQICDCEGAFSNSEGKLKSLFSRLSVLVTWSLENGVETADSMNARGYFLKNKTSLHFNPCRGKDFVFSSAAVILFVLTLCFNEGYSVYPVFYMPKISLLSLISYIALMLLPFIFILKEVLSCRSFQSET